MTEPRNLSNEALGRLCEEYWGYDLREGEPNSLYDVPEARRVYLARCTQEAARRIDRCAEIINTVAPGRWRLVRRERD